MSKNKFPEETERLIVEKATALFIKKGYDETSIQDIVDELGGLSKGAVYHHFKTKEEIFTAACIEIDKNNLEFFTRIRDDSTLNGLQKLKKMIWMATCNPNSKTEFALAKNMVNDSKFCQNQILDIFTKVVPLCILPIVNEGVSDGSIKTQYPKQLSEVLMLLINIWLNPFVVKSSKAEVRQKLEFLSALLTAIGLDLFDGTTIDAYEQYISEANL